ncbi:MAG TPA: glycosyltransferase family 2 protein [Planctomycetota bacterium]|nr:glycosyltransferase family 2 protein [Planctomycetota bacterium]
MNLSAIVCTYRRAEALERCLAAFAEQRASPPFEVLVVDNDPDRSAREVCRRFEGGSFPVRHVAASRPRNLPAARNEGIAASAAPIVGFLDDDSVPAPDWVAETVHAHGENAGAAAIGGRVIPLAMRPRIPPRPAGDAPIGRLLAFGRFTGNFDLDPGRPVPVDTVTGCNMTAKRGAFELVGGFDPAYEGTTVREETDWCVRARRCGLLLLLDPRIVAWHGDDPRGGSRPENGESYDLYKAYWDARNGTYFLRKNAGAGAALGFWAASLAAAALGRNFFQRFRTARARWAAARSLLRGFRDGGGIPVERGPRPATTPTSDPA